MAICGCQFFSHVLLSVSCPVLNLPPRKVHERTGKFKIGGWREGRLGPDVVMSSQGIGPVEAAYLNLILCGDWSSNHRRN